MMAYIKVTGHQCKCMELIISLKKLQTCKADTEACRGEKM